MGSREFCIIYIYLFALGSFADTVTSNYRYFVSLTTSEDRYITAINFRTRDDVCSFFLMAPDSWKSPLPNLKLTHLETMAEVRPPAETGKNNCIAELHFWNGMISRILGNPLARLFDLWICICYLLIFFIFQLVIQYL